MDNVIENTAEAIDQALEAGKIVVTDLPPVEYRNNPVALAGAFLGGVITTISGYFACKGIKKAADKKKAEKEAKDEKAADKADEEEKAEEKEEKSNKKK